MVGGDVEGSDMPHPHLFIWTTSINPPQDEEFNNCREVL
jgi:hypothetical protein